VVEIEISGTAVLVAESPPPLWKEYRAHAELFEVLDLDGSGDYWFVAIGEGGSWPRIVIAQRFSPGASGGFNSGFLLVPETSVAFLGAGQRLLAIDVREPRLLWEEGVEVGFWRWSRHQERVLMSAELALTAWSLRGERVWSIPVEPPWSYEVRGRAVDLEIMGERTTHDLATGEPPLP
jgi:hypothetical protein